MSSERLEPRIAQYVPHPLLQRKSVTGSSEIEEFLREKNSQRRELSRRRYSCGVEPRSEQYTPHPLLQIKSGKGQVNAIEELLGPASNKNNSPSLTTNQTEDSTSGPKISKKSNFEDFRSLIPSRKSSKSKDSSPIKFQSRFQARQEQYTPHPILQIRDEKLTLDDVLGPKPEKKTVRSLSLEASCSGGGGNINSGGGGGCGGSSEKGTINLASSLSPIEDESKRSTSSDRLQPREDQYESCSLLQDKTEDGISEFEKFLSEGLQESGIQTSSKKVKNDGHENVKVEVNATKGGKIENKAVAREDIWEKNESEKKTEEEERLKKTQANKSKEVIEREEKLKVEDNRAMIEEIINEMDGKKMEKKVREASKKGKIEDKSKNVGKEKEPSADLKDLKCINDESDVLLDLSSENDNKNHRVHFNAQNPQNPEDPSSNTLNKKTRRRKKCLIS